MSDVPFKTEAELVAAFCDEIRKRNENPRIEQRWTIYPETAGWDLLLVDQDRVQVGIEAKLSLNAKVICQALPDAFWADREGPDYRAVLIPRGKAQGHLHPIASALGLTVITVQREKGWRDRVDIWLSPTNLPDEQGHDWDVRGWFHWLPAKRCKLPDYIPDVEGGKPAPVALTEWKIKAIKLMILLDRRGYVTRRDMKILGISPTRWTDAYHGFLTADPIKGGYVRHASTPDLRAQHPVNYSQIEADFDTWAPADWNAGQPSLLPANDTPPKETAA